MAKKKSFALRIDPETFKLVEKWAEDEFRSVNGQFEWIIQQALKNAKRYKNKPPQNQDNTSMNDES